MLDDPPGEGTRTRHVLMLCWTAVLGLVALGTRSTLGRAPRREIIAIREVPGGRQQRFQLHVGQAEGR
jgi:hypothetical protein